jgi:hypothetical protein
MAGPYSSTAALVRGKVARFTLLDACGLPVATKGTYTTPGFIQVQAQKNYDNGDEIKVRQANGLIGVHEVGRQTFINYSITVDLIKVNPGVLTMLTGDPAVLDWQSSIAGWEERELISIDSQWALEVWTATSAVKCSAGGQVSGYMLYPLIGQTTIDVADISDKEITVSVHGMSYGNPSWGKGPYGGTGSIPGPVASDALNTATRLLQPVAVDAHRHFELTSVPPPSASPSDGPQSYTLPSPY